MKKLRSFLFSLSVIAIMLCTAFTVHSAFALTTPVILLSGKAEGKEIVVTATLKNNDGISTMQLNLNYDRDKLILTGCEREETAALSSLNWLASGNYDHYPYIITWLGKGNDSTNGKLLTLRFSVKDGADGQATVMFTYDRDKDISYDVSGDLQTRNIMTDTLRIELAAGETVDIVPVHEEAEETENKKDAGLIVGIVAGGTGVAATVVVVPWFVVRRKRV